MLGGSNHHRQGQPASQITTFGHTAIHYAPSLVAIAWFPA
jgi:hypothetical protein